MLNALCCAVGHNLRWLMRAVVRLKLAAAFLRLLRATIEPRAGAGLLQNWMTRVHHVFDLLPLTAHEPPIRLQLAR